MVQSLALRGSRDLQCEDSRQSPCRLQGCRDEDVYVADLHVGDTYVRVSMMMLLARQGSDGKSPVSCHMDES